MYATFQAKLNFLQCENTHTQLYGFIKQKKAVLQLFLAYSELSLLLLLFICFCLAGIVGLLAHSSTYTVCYKYSIDFYTH